MADRDALTQRQLPTMTLSDGSAHPPPVLPPTNRAAARFQVEGNVIITGGGGTLGLAAARALLEHGAGGVCLWDLEPTLRTAQRDLLALSRDFPTARVLGIAVDVTDAASVADAVGSSANALGALAHLFCFAGVVGCEHALEMSEERFRRTLEVNTTGAFLCAQAFARRLVEQRTGGSVTLIASISAHRVNFPQPQVAYNVSKAALLAMKNSLAAEWSAHSIRVNSISPGYMDTILNAGDGLADARAEWAKRCPMGRMGAVGELDGVCVLLASKAGSYITGSDLVVDGGTTVF